MNPSEAWVLLTNRSKHFARMSAGHGATTTSDVAGLLGGLNREPFLMGMAAECGDLGALKQIELILWVRVDFMAKRENWDPPRGQFTVRRLAAVALYETIGDHRCYACTGKGTKTFALRDDPGMILAPTFEHVSSVAGRVRCPACMGSGQVRLSGRKKADLAGINKDMWTRVWARRYEPVFSLSSGWLESARAYLAHRIRESEESTVDKPPPAREIPTPATAPKNLMQINGSCVWIKTRVKRLARASAPVGNSAPPELEYSALGRPTLRRPTRRLTR